MPFTAMIMVEITDVMISSLSKAAMAKGMSNLVFVVYSNALATLLLLLPFLLLSCRKKQGPLSFSMIQGFFLLALIGSVGQILVYTGIKYSSPALITALGNLIPIITFLLALLFRMEKVDMNKSSGKAKCVGTILAVTGALLITLYKGPVLILSSSTLNSSSEFVKKEIISSQKSNWIFGGFLFLIVCFLSAGWNIAQAWFVKKYPAEKMTNVFFFTLFVTLQTAGFAVIVETNPIVWQLRPDIEMFTIVFSAIFGSVVRIGVHTWCMQRKGPVFVAMFKPLGMIVAVVLLVSFLHDSLYLGSVLGSIVIGCGFYTVIWGQIKELDLDLPAHFDSESPSAPFVRH